MTTPLQPLHQRVGTDAFDRVLVTPVYAAGEAPVEGVNADALVEGLKRRGHRSAAVVADADHLAQELAETVQADDMIVCLGAGDITRWAAGLAAAITANRAVPA